MMSSISGVSGSSATMHTRVRPPPRDIGQDAQNLFSQIDTSGKGSFDKAGLEAALSASSTSSSTTSATTTSTSGTNDFADALFTQMDSDNDGNVTSQEFTSTLSMLANRFGQQAADRSSSQSGAGNKMDGRHSHDDVDTGFTQDQLSAQLTEIGSTDSKRSTLINNIVNNFAAADTNGDGKVNRDEAMAFDKSQSATATSSNTTASASTTASSSTSSNSTDLTQQLMAQILKMMQAYGLDAESQNVSQFSATA